MLHFLKDWWKFIQIHQYYTSMALIAQLNQGGVIEGVETSYFPLNHALHCREVMRSSTSVNQVL